jgi:hypothetical protein
LISAHKILLSLPRKKKKFMEIITRNILNVMDSDRVAV